MDYKTQHYLQKGLISQLLKQWQLSMLKRLETYNLTGPITLQVLLLALNMALEIARQFMAEGETISFLGLLTDGWGIYPDEVSLI